MSPGMYRYVRDPLSDQHEYAPRILDPPTSASVLLRPAPSLSKATAEHAKMIPIHTPVGAFARTCAHDARQRPGACSAGQPAGRPMGRPRTGWQLHHKDISLTIKWSLNPTLTDV